MSWFLKFSFALTFLPPPADALSPASTAVQATLTSVSPKREVEFVSQIFDSSSCLWFLSFGLLHFQPSPLSCLLSSLHLCLNIFWQPDFNSSCHGRPVLVWWVFYCSSVSSSRLYLLLHISSTSWSWQPWPSLLSSLSLDFESLLKVRCLQMSI